MFLLEMLIFQNYAIDFYQFKSKLKISIKSKNQIQKNRNLENLFSIFIVPQDLGQT